MAAALSTADKQLGLQSRGVPLYLLRVDRIVANLVRGSISAAVLL
jgi:hypothetical protein